MPNEVYELIATISGWIITALIAFCIYFLKQIADDIKETRRTVATHAVVLAAHDVMYQLWLETLANHEDHPHRRETDRLRAMVEKVAAAQLDKR